MGWGTPKICSPSGSQRSFPQYMKISQYGSLNRHKGTAEQERRTMREPRDACKPKPGWALGLLRGQ